MTQQLGLAILAALDKFAQCLNDPKGDGSGDGSMCPDGDSYNSACQIIREIIADHQPAAAGAASDLVALLNSTPGLETALIQAAWTQGVDGPVAQAITCLKRGPAAPFDESLVEINRKRFSSTQGEVELSYDGVRINQFGDAYTLDGAGQWVGRSDAYWIAVARKHRLGA